MERDPRHPPLVSEVCASEPNNAPVSDFMVLGSQAGKFMWVLRVQRQALSRRNIFPAPPVMSLHLFSSLCHFIKTIKAASCRRPHHSDVRQCWMQSGVVEVASEGSSEGPLL